MPAITNRRTVLAAALACMALASPSAAESARVVDGDTLRLGTVTYRLWGIDAPETKQACNGWPAGVESSKALAALVRDHEVRCEPKTTDRYGRTVAMCRADGADLGAAMVRAGMAWAFVRYSHDYVQQEIEAKTAGLGIHSHGCEPAWDWRARQRR